MVIMKCFNREVSKFLLPSKNELCATRVVAKMAFSVNCCHKELLLRCCRHSGFASDGSTWQKKNSFGGRNHLG